MQPEDFEEKIVNYLKKNYYRITEKCPDYIIFTDDEFSERRSSRSDIYTRMGEGKFEFHSTTGQQTNVKLIYLTSITFPLAVMVIMSVFGIYIESVAPIILSFVFVIPIIFRILYLKGNVFREILEC
jgi:hypothetical protein